MPLYQKWNRMEDYKHDYIEQFDNQYSVKWVTWTNNNSLVHCLQFYDSFSVCLIIMCPFSLLLHWNGAFTSAQNVSYLFECTWEYIGRSLHCFWVYTECQHTMIYPKIQKERILYISYTSNASKKICVT